MDREHFERQAEHCRHKALAYVGKPEALVLLIIAREFDRLAGGELDLQFPSKPAASERRPETAG